MTPAERCRRVSGALRTALALPPGDRTPFLRAFALQLACSLRARLGPRLGARWLPADETLEPTPDSRGAPPDPRLLEIFRLAASLQPLGSDCLPRALALGRFLRHDGCTTRLVLGVRRGPSGIEGHAWREWRGRPLEEEAFVRRYRPLRGVGPGMRRQHTEAL